MAPPADADYTLEDIVWDENSLRLMLDLMLSQGGLGAIDLIKAWDVRSGGRPFAGHRTDAHASEPATTPRDCSR